ncbi:hypothetical protein PISMIDRAFT_106394, partial [Pisolithus microcarpus 441]
QAAACALLRHSAHLDGAHFQSRVKGRLHPVYAGFNPNMNDKKARSLSSKELVEASLQDVFNAVMMQDCLDGGITLLLHCAGVKSTSVQTADEVTVDLYVTPREFRETPERIRGDVAVLVQAFCQEFTLPHFQCFNKHCEVEIITPPEDSGKAHFYSFPAIVFMIISASWLYQHRWATVFTIPLIAYQQPYSVLGSGPLPCRLAEVHPPLKVIEQMPPATELPAHSTSMFLTNPIIFGPTLISIGPNTDAVLDRFKINDKVLPTIRSSRWEVKLRSSQWNLTYKQAVNLSQALIADTQGSAGTRLERVSKYMSLIAPILTAPILA